MKRTFRTLFIIVVPLSGLSSFLLPTRAPVVLQVASGRIRSFSPSILFSLRGLSSVIVALGRDMHDGFVYMECVFDMFCKLSEITVKILDSNPA